MKRLFQFIIFACLTMAILSCGEDRTHEFEEKTQHNRWLLGELKDKYLWADTLSGYEPQWKEFFATPENFLKKISSKTGDKWSYVTVDTIVSDPHSNGYFNHNNSYGFDFMPMTDPTGKTSTLYIRVMTVYPNSPAAEAGLQRDDFFCTYNGFKISQKNLSKLEKGLGITVGVQRLTEKDGEYEFVTKDSVKIGPSRRVEDVAFPVYKTFTEQGISIGYLMCTRLVEGDNGGNEYQQALDRIMQQMKNASVSEMVLDMRLCNYGTLEMAQRLASYVVNPKNINDVIAKTIHNKAYSAENKSITYDSSVANLSLGRVFVIVSERTKGAAEWMISCLKKTMGDENVILVGVDTYGQCVMTELVGSSFSVNLYAATAYVADSDGNYSFKALSPAEQTTEMLFAYLHNYGDKEEPLLNKALSLMLN